MKETWKRITAAALALTLAFSLAACGEKSQTRKSNYTLSKPNEYPIVAEPASLSIFVPKPVTIADLETNEFTKWYEEKTGVHIDWAIASGDTKQAINLRLAGGDLPDVFMFCNFTPNEVLSYGKQGIFVDIKDYVDNDMYYFKEILDRRDDLRKKLTYDGKIYGLPRVLEGMSGQTLFKMWVYQPWLDKLGLKEPETTEDFYQMLKAFKEKDPNGNGKADEIPLAARGINSDPGIESFIMNAFTFCGDITRAYVEDGKVKNAVFDEGYREGVRYIKKLYDEGLILKDTFIIDRTRLTSIGENEPDPILGAGAGQWPGMFTIQGASSGRFDEYTAISPLTGPTGLKQTPRTDSASGLPTQFCVTNACEEPAIAVKWADYFYSDEGYYKSTGKKGYRPAEPGEIGLNGKQAKFVYDPALVEEEDESFGAVQNKVWSTNFGLAYGDEETEGSVKQPEDSYVTMLYRTSADKYIPYMVDKRMPAVPMDEEYIAEYVDLETTLYETMNKAFVRFVSGERDIDKDWDAYLKELNDLGMQRYLEILQMAYDKYGK